MGNRECWPEAWHINETIYPRIFAGETVSFRETMYPLAPHGVVEDYYLTLSYSPVRDETGGVGGVFVTVFDVTSEVRTREERDRALAEARAERERLYEVFAQAPAAIAVLEGPEHTFTVANARYRALVGGRDVVGRTLREALPEVESQGFPALLDRRARDRRAVRGRPTRCVQLDRRGDGTLEDGVRRLRVPAAARRVGRGVRHHGARGGDDRAGAGAPAHRDARRRARGDARVRSPTP